MESVGTGQTFSGTGQVPAAAPNTPGSLVELTPEQAEKNQQQITAYQDGRLATVPSFEDEGSTLLANFISGESALFYSSIVNDGERGTQVKMYNAIADALSLRDNVNKEIVVTDYMAHPVRLMDEDTGEFAAVLRIILVAQDGLSYAAMSRGLRSSIERIVAMVGPAPWTPGIRMLAVEKAVKSSAVNRVLTLRLVADSTPPKK